MPKALHRYRLTVIVALIALLTLSACHDNKKAQESVAGITKTYTIAPITLTLRVDKAAMNIAQHLSLTLSAVMPEDYEASFPDFPSTEGSFAQTRTILPKVKLGKSGKVTRSKTYILEAFLAGNYTIAPLTVKFSGKDKQVTKISTETLTIKVNSLLDANEKIPDIGQLAPVVEEPYGRNFYILIAVIILLVVAAIFLLVRYLRRRALKPPPPPVPAHELARSALDKLLAANLLQRGEIKLFHQRVSDILRNYIEKRFALRAPEQTTEEFLYELGHANALRAEHKGLLHDFLTHCDLVKFAEHIPAEQDSLQTVELCRLFIEQTQRIVSEGGKK